MTKSKWQATSNEQPARAFEPGTGPTLSALHSTLSDTQGSALVLVLVMVTLVTTIVGAVLMGTLLQLRLILKEKHRLQAFYLAEAGIYKAIWHLSGNGGKDIFWRPQNEVIEIFDNQTAAVTVQQWGGFLQVTSTANVHRAGKSIQVLLGEQPPAPFQQAVFVGGVDYPLVVTGRNRIVGDVTVGPEGVKKGRIKGRDFEGDHLVDGRVIRQRRPQMPYFNPVMMQTVFRKYLEVLENPPGDQVFGARTFVDGEIFPLAQERSLHVHGEVQLNYSNAGAAIRGPGMVSAVYSRNYTNQQGTIYGTVVTGQFFLYESPTIYLNWLQDAVTDRAQLPEDFLLPIGFNERSRLEVLKWEEIR